MLVKKCDLIFPLFGKGSAICRAPAGGGAVSASAVGQFWREGFRFLRGFLDMAASGHRIFYLTILYSYINITN